MYVGRDMTELTMMSIEEWKDSELAHFHHSFQQIMPYLNQEGQTIYQEIMKEMQNRGGFKRQEATYTSGTQIVHD